ncbi:MAG: cystathionine beta-lyase [Comamonas sp.]
MTTPTPAEPGPATRLLHAGRAPLQDGAGPLNVGVTRGSTLRVASSAERQSRWQRRLAGDNVAAYGIHGFDTHRALEDALLALEGGDRAFLAPSGHAAIMLVLLALLSHGDHALVSDAAYAPIRRSHQTLLARLGISLSYFSPGRDDLAAHLRPNTRLLYLESPGSFLGEILDLPALAGQARARGIPVAVDNTWGAGLLLRPLELGADVSIQAGTKYLGGHADLLLGSVVSASDALSRRIAATSDALGLSVGADDAWLALRGLRTLPVRLAQHQSSALEVARFLQGRAEVKRVFYPALQDDPGHALWQRDFDGANGLLAFELQPGHSGAAFVDTLRLFSIGASWGGYDSLALLADSDRLAVQGHWHAIGGQGDVVRLHVGLEDPPDLIADLAQAFGAI